MKKKDKKISKIDNSSLTKVSGGAYIKGVTDKEYLELQKKLLNSKEILSMNEFDKLTSWEKDQEK